jgi:hypothetical protein
MTNLMELDNISRASTRSPQAALERFLDSAVAQCAAVASPVERRP